MKERRGEKHNIFIYIYNKIQEYIPEREHEYGYEYEHEHEHEHEREREHEHEHENLYIIMLLCSLLF